MELFWQHQRTGSCSVNLLELYQLQIFESRLLWNEPGKLACLLNWTIKLPIWINRSSLESLCFVWWHAFYLCYHAFLYLGLLLRRFNLLNWSLDCWMASTRWYYCLPMGSPTMGRISYLRCHCFSKGCSQRRSSL